MRAFVLLSLFCLFLSGPAAQDTEAPPARITSTYSQEELSERMRKAVRFLLNDQNPDGSWGGFHDMAVGIDEMWSNVETHRSWTVATTGLCCMALLEVAQLGVDGVDAAYDRGLQYLLENTRLKRPSDWDVDNNWGNVYGLQALVIAYNHADAEDTELRAKIGSSIEGLIKSLRYYQAISHGWGYYDNQPVTQRPQWATSFMTAVALLALYDARHAGFSVDEKMLTIAVRALQRCRLPNGAYTYSIEAIPSPGAPDDINQIKGSLCRIHVCDLALIRAGKEFTTEVITSEDIRKGLDHFFREHRFIDIARKKPIPHEAYYYNSGYFYFFGHYYVALAIDLLEEEEQEKWRAKLRHEILKTQEEDGSMWDFYMSSYGKPYGVAYSLLALAR